MMKEYVITSGDCDVLFRDIGSVAVVSCRYYQSVVDVCRTLMILRSSTVAVYVILATVQRYHLFVWTVFSPKLLYEAVFSLVISVFVLLLFMILTCIVSRASTKSIRSSL